MGRISSLVGLGTVVLVALLLAGCGLVPLPNFITNQHPAWAMNSADCATLGPAIATLITVSPMGISAAATIAKAFCDGESSLVAGQPMQVTQTTSTVQGTTKTP